MNLTRKLFPLALILIISISSCAVDVEKSETEYILKNMTLEQKVGQLIMVAIPGREMNRKTEKILKDYLPGGVILFGYNLDKNKDIRKYIENMQSVSMQNSGIPLFISIDQEGGRVKRLEREVTQFPGNMALGTFNKTDRTYMMARVLGLQMRDLGINMNLAPVLDVNNNPDNPVINLRSFGSDAGLVSGHGTSYIMGLQESMCIAVGKHFPGHGDTNKDSHLTLPVINYSLERLRKLEFIPFVDAVRKGVESMMTAHISYPGVLESGIPATLSGKFLTEILRGEMKFKGVVFTDDLEMKAISKKMKIGEAAVTSFRAGADIILISSFGKNTGEIYNSILESVKSGDIPVKRVDDSIRRIIKLKLRYRIISFINRKMGTGKVFFTKSERRILDKADSLNREISRGAILFTGKEVSLLSDKTNKRIFISSDEILNKYIKPAENDRFFKSTAEFLRGKYNNKGKTDILVFYHVKKLNPNIQLLKSVSRFCKKNNLNLIIISSGNPFPVARTLPSESMLVSFSNTDESVKQLAACINGEFKPMVKSSIQPGMKKMK